MSKLHKSYSSESEPQKDSRYNATTKTSRKGSKT